MRSSGHRRERAHLVQRGGISIPVISFNNVLENPLQTGGEHLMSGRLRVQGTRVDDTRSVLATHHVGDPC